MTVSPIERRIRAGLPLIRFMQTYLPLSVSRYLLKLSLSQARLDADIKREPVLADGVPCEWVYSNTSQAEQVLLYLHGGGFVLGLSHLHLQMVAHLSRKMGLRVLLVDYRLAPEHPFPAALDDCITAYLWLIKAGTSARKIVIAGDSAGGNLTITTMMKLRDNGEPLPAAAACLSPVTDLTPRDYQQTDFKDPLLSPKMIKFYAQSYIGTNDARNPLISPVFGNLQSLPPLLVHDGEEETLREDAIKIVTLADSAGVHAKLEIYPRMWHVWQINLVLPQAQKSLEDIARFLKSHLE